MRRTYTLARSVNGRTEPRYYRVRLAKLTPNGLHGYECLLGINGKPYFVFLQERRILGILISRTYFSDKQEFKSLRDLVKFKTNTV